MLEDGSFLTMAGYPFGETHGCHSHISMRAASLIRAFKVVYNHAFLEILCDGERVVLHN